MDGAGKPAASGVSIRPVLRWKHPDPHPASPALSSQSLGGTGWAEYPPPGWKGERRREKPRRPCLSPPTQSVEDPRHEVEAHKHGYPAGRPQAPRLHGVALLFPTKHLLEDKRGGAVTSQLRGSPAYPVGRARAEGPGLTQEPLRFWTDQKEERALPRPTCLAHLAAQSRQAWALRSQPASSKSHQPTVSPNKPDPPAAAAPSRGHLSSRGVKPRAPALLSGGQL